MNKTSQRSTLCNLSFANALCALVACPLMLAAVAYGNTIVISRYHGLESQGIVEMNLRVPAGYDGSDLGPKVDVPEYLTHSIFKYPRNLALLATFVFGANAVLLALLAFRSRPDADETLPEHLDSEKSP